MHLVSRNLKKTLKRFSSTLLVIEQQAGVPLPSNSHALTAASKLGFPITCLVAGTEGTVEKAAKLVAEYPGVTKVLAAKGSQYDHNLAEGHADLIASQGKNYSHIIACHSQYAKNVFPRAAALLDVSPITDVLEIDGSDAFKRPIYAGNAIASVKSSDKIKMITVRSTAFPPSTVSGGTASVDNVECASNGICF